MKFFYATTWVPTPEFWALLTMIVGVATKWVIQITKDRKELLQKRLDRERDLVDREQTRLDLAAASERTRLDLVASAEQTRLDLLTAANLNSEQLANISDQVATVDENGKLRLKAMLGSNATTRHFNKVAIETSNGIKKDLMEKGVKLIEVPVEVVHKD